MKKLHEVDFKEEWKGNYLGRRVGIVVVVFKSLFKKVFLIFERLSLKNNIFGIELRFQINMSLFQSSVFTKYLRCFNKKEIIILLLLFLGLNLFNRCQTDPVKIALNTNSQSKGLKAIKELTDQNAISEVARYARNDEIRLAAFNMLTDQVLISEFINYIDFVSFDKTFCRIFAVRITDQFLLAQIFVENKDSAIQNIVNKKLTDPLLLKLINSIDSVPIEHQRHLIAELWPAISMFKNPDVQKVSGEILSLKLDWDTIQQSYMAIRFDGGSTTGSNTKYGEKVNFIIKLEKIKNPLSFTWTTHFPGKVEDFSFLPSYINPGDLVSPVFNYLSHSIIEKIAREDKDPRIQFAAALKLDDNSLLTKIIMTNEDSEFRINLLEKLNDQILLKRIALEDNNWEVRRAAVYKIKDQILLTIIAIEAKDLDIAEQAIYGIKDQSQLSKVALEALNSTIRQRAIYQLNDKSVLERIANEDTDDDVKKASQERLNSLKK